MKTLNFLKHLFFTSTLLFCIVAQGQKNQQNPNTEFVEICGMSEATKKYHKEHPEAKEKAKKALQNFIKESVTFLRDQNLNRSAAGNYVIPVVIHNIYGDRNGPEYITLENAQTAIDRLNSDFKGLTAVDHDMNNCNTTFNNDIPENLVLDCASPYSLQYIDDSGDTLNNIGQANITFKLAEKDMFGYPTSGITRTKDPISYQSKGDGSPLRNVIQWPRNKYLNLYVVYNSNDPFSGVSQYPEITDADELTDGVAMPYWSFIQEPDLTNPKSNYASIISHEVGHWLGLRHIWGGEERADQCSVDDFSFLTDLDTAAFDGLNDLLQTENTTVEQLFNDTPNCIGHHKSPDYNTVCASIPENECSGVDYAYDNLMAYSRCYKGFTRGQVRYMECVLNSTLSDRKSIQDNLIYTLYDDDALNPRVVFSNSSFEICQDAASTATMENVLEIQLVDCQFVGISPGSYISPSLFDFDTYFNAQIQVTGPQTAEMQVLNVFNQSEIQDYDNLLITFDNSIFSTNITETNRSKILNINVGQFDGGYKDICPNFQLGPNSLTASEFKIGDETLNVYYYENEFQFVPLHSIDFCVDPATGNLKTFSGGWIQSSSGNFISASIGDLNDPVIPIILDENSISTDADGYFYAGMIYREGCSERYGWLRMQVVNCNGQRDIVIHDYYFNANVHQAVNIGYFTEPFISFSSSVIEENRTNDGSFAERIKIRLEPSNFSFSTNINNAFEMLGDNISNVNFQMNYIGPQEVELEILGAYPNVSIEKELFQLSLPAACFSSNSIPSGLTMPCDGKIKVDFYQPEGFELVQSDHKDDGVDQLVLGLDLFDHNDLNPSTGSLEKINLFAQPIDHVVYDCGPPFTAQSGVLLYQDANVFLQVQMLCFSNTREVILHSNGQNALGGGVYKSCKNGVKGSEACASIAGMAPVPGSTNDHEDLYLRDWAMDSFTPDEAYIAVKISKSCGEVYYGWLSIDLSGPTPYFESLVLNNEANVQVPLGILDPGTVCIPEIENPNGDYAHIESFEVLGHNGSTLSNVDLAPPLEGYSDFKNLSVDLLENSAYNINLKTGGFTSSNNFYIWADWNKNGLFASEELIASGSTVSGQASTYSMTIPAGVEPGSYTLRLTTSVHLIYNEDGCYYFQYGEVEDYTINILGPGTTSNGNCLPEISNVYDYLPYINGASYPGIHNLNNGLSSSGYNDFTNFNISGKRGYGNVVKITLDIANPQYNYYNYIWVDWNKNGEFSANELVASTYNNEQLTFAISKYRAIGFYTLRILTSLNQSPTGDGCDVIYAGEVEDYTLQVSKSKTEIVNGTLTFVNINTVFGIGQTFGTIMPCLGCKTDGETTTENTTILENSVTMFPNPSQGPVTLQFGINKSGPVKIEIYGIDGQLEKMVVQDDFLEPGMYQTIIDTEFIPKGIHLVRIQVGKWSSTLKLVVID